jgi:hypothetical protein
MLEAWSRYYRKIAMDAVEIARADIVDEQARGTDGALDQEMEFCFGRRGNVCRSREEERACGFGSCGKGKVWITCAEGGGWGCWSVIVSAT